MHVSGEEGPPPEQVQPSSI
jgi:hypothetical protein